MILLINGLFAQSLRYAQKIILGISTICTPRAFPEWHLWLFFSHALSACNAQAGLILYKNPHLWTDTTYESYFVPVPYQSDEGEGSVDYCLDTLARFSNTFQIRLKIEVEETKWIYD